MSDMSEGQLLWLDQYDYKTMLKMDISLTLKLWKSYAWKVNGIRKGMDLKLTWSKVGFYSFRFC